jgi:hypothetical protein
MILLLALTSSPAWAAEATDSGSTPPKAQPSGPPAVTTPAVSNPAAVSSSAQTTTPSSPPTDAPAAATTAATSPAGTSDPTGSQAPASGVTLSGSVKAQSTLTPSEPLPGPYENDRKKVRNWLLEAKKRGVGLSAYMPVWNDMEGAVRAGASDKDVKTKLDGICRSISNQVRDSSKIQAFRPVKPKPGPDEDIEVVRVKWIGQKGSDPLFRDKADKWYNNAVDLLPREQRSDSQIRRKLHDQRDQIYKEMKSRWESGEKAWGPRQYVNMNQDMGQYRGVQFRNTNQERRTREETTDNVENNSQKNW